MSIHIFERQHPEGWVYPCSVSDVECRLSLLPPGDLEGLWAVGLVPATRKNMSANARYFGGTKPLVEIYSLPSSLSFKLAANTKPHHIDEWLQEELSYGMHIEQTGARYVCNWSKEDLRRFILDHVLAHEVGHHVFERQYGYKPGRASEHFAESYARRHRVDRPR